MSGINRITRRITQIGIFLVLLAVVAGIYAVYFHFPSMREKLAFQTEAAIGKWFPTGKDGLIRYETSVDLKNRKLSLTEFTVDNGSGRVLDNFTLKSYSVIADSIDLTLSGTVDPRPVSIERLSGFELNGNVTFRDVRQYFTANNSGLRVDGMRYNSFTEKVILSIEMTEIVGFETEIVGNLEISNEGNLTLVDRKYRNPDGPVSPEVVAFIEEHSDPTIRFSIFGIPLKLKEFSIGESSLEITLTEQ